MVHMGTKKGLVMKNEIYLYGTVGADFWGEDFFTAIQVRDMLAGVEGDVSVRINSGGGIAPEGQAIYNLLKDHDGIVNVIIDGMAASAASLIAMAGDTITMRAGATIMIHDPAQWTTEGRGTEDDHLHAAKGLSVMAKSFAKVYAARAGISVEAARDVMKAETWLEGDDAINAGFATHTDEETSAIAARFDYSIYAHAPKDLQRSNVPAASRKSRTAVMAMMAGTSARTPKGNTMRDEEQQMVDDQDDTTITTEDEQDDKAVTAVEDEEIEDVADGDDDAADEDDEIPEAAQIVDVVASLGGTFEMASNMIRRRLTLSQSVEEIKMQQRSKNPMTNKTPAGRQTASILRDERDTRRRGMTMALSAQIARTAEVDDRARPYMNMSIVEMAAASIGHKGPIRNAGQRVDVLMAASHSTSDFPGIFENALNRVLLERYAVAEPTYKMISRQRNFADFREVSLLRVGDFPTLKKVAENGEIEFGTFGESKETAVLAAYARGIRISRQMLVNDDLGAIDEVLSTVASAVARFEEQTFYGFALAVKMADNVNMFHASHKNLAAAGSPINVASVGDGRAAIRKQTGVGGEKLGLNPTVLLVGPNQETAAEQLVAAITPQSSAVVNPFSGKLTVVMSAEIEDNSWYLFAGPTGGGANFVHGYLEGAEAPRVRMDEPFGQQGMAATVELDFGLGAADFRGGYKNPGL